MYNLENKVAFITGGSHGIGRAIALSLAKEKCKVAICARGVENCVKVKHELIKIGVENRSICAVDALIDGKLEEALNKVINDWGKIDILINNVGGGGRWGKEDPTITSKEVWKEVYQKNAGAATECTMIALPYMLSNKWGRVVTISSIAGFKNTSRPWFGMACVSKVVLMKSLSLMQRYSKNNITFNTVAPGAVLIPDTGWTKMKNELPKEYNDFVKKLPLNRLITPEEVANVVTFLCSNLASGVNGEYIRVDGSQTEGI